MSVEHKVLYKVLKDQTNRQILCLLNEKESLTYTELADSLNLTPGMIDYHLKTLHQLITKTPEDKYSLSEKGKTVYHSLKDLPEKTKATLKWKITYGITVISLFTVISFIWAVLDLLGLPMVHLLMGNCGIANVCILCYNKNNV